MKKFRHSAIFSLLALLPALLLFWWLWKYDFGLLDDAYIPMTYARNAAQGHGIVFFPNGERIEGYTSPIWMGWLTLAALCGLPLPETAKLSGLIFALAVVFLSVASYRRQFHTEETPRYFGAVFWPLAAGLAVVCDVPLAAYSVSGMEAAAYSFFLLLLAYTLILRRSDFIVCLMMLVVSLTRPEGQAFWFLCMGIWWLQGRLNKGLSLMFLTTVIIPYTFFILFRVYYFGQPFPNTFYAKHNFGGLELVGRGLEYTWYFFRPRPLYLFAILALLLEKKELRGASLSFILFALLHVALVTVEGGDHFTLHRFMVPAIAFFAILSVRGVSLCAERLIQDRFGRIEGAKSKAVNAVLAVVVIAMLPAHGSQLFEFSRDTRCHFAQGAKYHLSTVKWTRSWALVGQWLKEKYPPDTLIAVINSGAIPYYSELRCIDMLGLNDRTIARTPMKYESLCLPGHDRSNSGYVLEQKPKLIQLFPLLFFTSKPYPENELEDMITYPAQMDMWQEQRFHDLYEYRTEETRLGFISYFERRDDVDG